MPAYKDPKNNTWYVKYSQKELDGKFHGKNSLFACGRRCAPPGHSLFRFSFIIMQEAALGKEELFWGARGGRSKKKGERKNPAKLCGVWS